MSVFYPFQDGSVPRVDLAEDPPLGTVWRYKWVLDRGRAGVLVEVVTRINLQVHLSYHLPSHLDTLRRLAYLSGGEG